MLLEGKVAAVTGGGSGIGREICKLMAAEGAKVVVNDLGTAVDGVGQSHSAADQTVEMIKQAGGRQHPIMIPSRPRKADRILFRLRSTPTARSTFWCTSPGFYGTA